MPDVCSPPPGLKSVDARAGPPRRGAERTQSFRYARLPNQDEVEQGAAPASLLLAHTSPPRLKSHRGQVGLPCPALQRQLPELTHEASRLQEAPQSPACLGTPPNFQKSIPGA